MIWISIIACIVIGALAIYFIVNIHKGKYAKLETNKKLRVIYLVLLYIACINRGIGLVGSIAALASDYDFSSTSSSSSYKEEIKALGFPTNEIDYWIDNAMDQYNCSLVKVTSVKADGKWCLKLYVDVLYYHDFRSKGEPHKGVVNLCFEPSNGRIFDGDFEVLD